MRKDPPFDMEYVYSTYLLECAEREGARIFNRPRAIRDHNEKLAIAKFREFIAPTLVTRDMALVAQFIDEHGGRRREAARRHGRNVVFRVREGRPQSQRDRRDRVAATGGTMVMVQRYLPEIVDGDKRILLIGGEVVPFCLARIPKEGESRGNLAAGGRGEARPLTRARPRDRGGAGAQAVGGGPPGGRARRHRAVPDRGQRHLADVLRGNHPADRLRRARACSRMRWRARRGRIAAALMLP